MDAALVPLLLLLLLCIALPPFSSGDDEFRLPDCTNGTCTTAEECRAESALSTCRVEGESVYVCCDEGKSEDAIGFPAEEYPEEEEELSVRAAGNEAKQRSPPPPRKSRRKRKVSDIRCVEYSALAGDPFRPWASENPTRLIRDTRNPALVYTVVGGTKTALNEFPHMAAIGFPKNGGIEWNCGGTLVSDEFVLTAAHCTAEKPTRVRLGELDLTTRADGAHTEEFSVSEIINHPKYKSPGKYNDIALLRLSRRVILRRNIRPACLHASKSVSQSTAIATGWGRTGYFENPSDTLLKVELKMYNQSTCQRIYPKGSDNRSIPRGIISSQMCAGDLEGGKDTCSGDSGGPLQIKIKENPPVYRVIGVTSFGKLCALEDTLGVYTRVSSFVPWIESVVWPSST